MVIGSQGIWRQFVQPAKLGDLVAQHLEHETRVKLRIVDVPGLEPAVVVVFDQMVIRVSRECQRIEPKRIDRRFSQSGKSGRSRGKVRQIVKENIVPNDVIETSAIVIEFPQAGFDVALCDKAWFLDITRHSGKCENPCLFGIDLEIDGNASSENVRLSYVRGGVHFVARWVSCQASEVHIFGDY